MYEHTWFHESRKANKYGSTFSNISPFNQWYELSHHYATWYHGRICHSELKESEGWRRLQISRSLSSFFHLKSCNLLKCIFKNRRYKNLSTATFSQLDSPVDIIIFAWMLTTRENLSFDFYPSRRVEFDFFKLRISQNVEINRYFKRPWFAKTNQIFQIYNRKFFDKGVVMSG